MRRRAVALLVGALSATGGAEAASFDESGRFAFDGAALFRQGFELDEWAGEETDASDPAPAAEVVPDALEGERVVRLPRFESVAVPLALPGEHGAYRVRAWARGSIIATVSVSYAGRTDDFGVLYPTGRMTSDGWYEVETGSFSVGSSRLRAVAAGFFTPAAEGAEVDAVEVVADGAPQVGGPCRGIADKGACAPDQVCEWGRCRNMISRVPALPSGEDRDALVTSLGNRFEFLYGPFKNRVLDLPNALAEIEGMRGAPDGWSFWQRFRTAIHRLHDWHTSSSGLEGFLLENPRPIALCFLEGDADRSRGAAPSHPELLDVLVSNVGSVNTFGLRVGDRLVSVDGRHPVEWARSLISVNPGHHSASNHRTHGEFVQSLPSLIARFADRIEVVRCDPAADACSAAGETLSISALGASPPGTESGLRCDNRPVRHVGGSSMSGVRSAIVDESDETEAIYGLQWSSLAVTGSGGGVERALRDAVALWRAKARGVMLDHRTGNGGTNLGPPILWDFVRTPTPLDAFFFRQSSKDTGPATLSDGRALFDALAAEGLVESAGSASARTDVPVALLITVDGSASDWLPLGMKGAPKARIFGPYETAGAFSTLFNFSYWSGVGYSIAVGDTIHVSGDTLNGVGVAPDVVVRPLQSDLMAGRDTVYDVALAWVRSELPP